MALHAILFLYFAYVSDTPSVLKRDPPIEIVFTEPDRNQSIMVDVPDQPETQIKPKKEVRFKSNASRRTELETFAKPRRAAPLQAAIQSGAQGGQATQKNNQKESVSETGTYRAKDDREELKLPGFGTSSQPLVPAYVQQQMPPGVRLGNVTALNTDQHRFYSFNRRLLERFIPLWGNRVRSALYQWLKENNAPAVSKAWVTNVEVIMDKKGEIIEVQPFRLSGLWSIDEASIESFKQVRNVPNPPAEMVDENGYIHLQFQTEVLWIRQPNMNFQSGN